jgi:hypothetical protein
MTAKFKKGAYLKCEKREMYITIKTCQYKGKLFMEGERYEPKVGELVPYHIVPVTSLKDIPIGVDPVVYMAKQREKRELDAAVRGVGHTKGVNPESGAAVIPQYPKTDAALAVEDAIAKAGSEGVKPVAEPDTAIGPHAEIDDAGAIEPDVALDADNPAKAFL